jgi:hypothetical protein
MPGGQEIIVGLALQQLTTVYCKGAGRGRRIDPFAGLRHWGRAGSEKPSPVGIVCHPQLVLGLPEGFVEYSSGRRSAPGRRAEPVCAPADPLSCSKRRSPRGAWQVGGVNGWRCGSAKRPVLRIAGPADRRDKEHLVDTWPSDSCYGGGPEGVAPHRQVADIVFVELDLRLLIERKA